MQLKRMTAVPALALGAVLLLALAGPVLAKTTTWTDADGGDSDWLTAGNWDNGAAVDGDTIDISDTTTPTNIPDQTGETYHFSVDSGVEVTLANWINGGAIGSVSVGQAGAVITAGADITGDLTVITGMLKIAAPRTLAGTVVLYGGVFELDASGVVAASEVVEANTTCRIEIAADTTLQIAATKSLYGTAVPIENAGIIQGTVNMTAATWIGDGVITVDQDGTLNLGTDDDNDQDVTVTAAAVTIGDDFRCDSFTLNAVAAEAELTGAGKTITVGAGGVSYVDGALDGAGTLNITVAETCNGQWDNTTTPLGTLTVEGDPKPTLTIGTSNDLMCKAVTGSGDITIPAGKQRLQAWYPAANFWTHTGTVTTTSTGYLYFVVNADIANAANIDTGADTKTMVSGGNNTLTASGTFDIGAGALTLMGASGTASTGLSVAGNFTCGALQLGDNNNDRPGRLTLAAGTTNTISGAVDAGNAVSETPSQLNLAGTVKPGGGWTLANIAPNFGSAVIEASGDLTIDGTGAGTITNTAAVIFANGNTVTMDDVGYATTSAPLICVSCTPGATANGAGVEFQVPARMMLGVGF